MTETLTPWWQTTRFRLIALVAFLLGLVALQWSTTGFVVTFFADDWVQYVRAETGPWLELFNPRAATPIANKLAVLLGGDPFVAVNLILYAFLSIKAVASSLSLLVLSRNHTAALMFGALVAVFPADSAVFNKGVLPATLALAMLCLGCLCLYAGYVYRKAWLIAPMLVCGLLVAFIYEALFPAMVFLPLALILHDRKVTRRWLVWAGLWILPLVITLLYTASLVSANPNALGYQSALTDVPNSLELLVIYTLRFFGYLFYKGWFSDLGPSISEARQIPAIIAGLLMGATTFYLARGTGYRSHGARFWLVTALFGFVLMGLGFGPYLFTALRDTSDRTLYVAMIGASLLTTAVACFVLFIQPRLRLLVALLFALLTSVGTLRMIGQQEIYAIDSGDQMRVADAVYGVTGMIAPGTMLVIIDDSSDRRIDPIFVTLSLYAEYVFAFLNHPNPMRAVLCYPEELVWGSYGESCRLDTNGVQVDFVANVQSVSAPLSELVIVRYADDGRVTLVQPGELPFAAEGYQPEARIQPGVLPERAQTLFGTAPDQPRN
ncbi:MAG: hypothetical protein KME04_08085 [Pleurocapsa minor GSE-CHR-MK-17-07R]|jgi:hypothetical protein|nr:hypothetical protein [Pleurocapsa minor GSE-CHR-MK 17-07R]